MNKLLLQPTDVLFFRDGRPMGGSLSGHAAAWPLPTVTNAALHAALHRADLESALGGKLHGHDHHRRDGSVAKDVRKFGSLLTAGPFPVLKHKDEQDTWLFPRPLDVGLDANAPTLHPLATDFTTTHSSLPKPLRYAVANQNGPTKTTPTPWWNAAAWECYLGTGKGGAKPCFHKNEDFADTEFSYGIGMDAESGTQDGERFYSAHYLRLRPEAQLGLLASAKDKDFRDSKDNDDLIISLFPNHGTQTPVIVGGQQRLCSVRREHKEELPLPKGQHEGFSQTHVCEKSVWLVKWVLLTPAIFPAINADTAMGINAHPGGWLPNWIFLDWDEEKNEARDNSRNGEVLLKTGDIKRREINGKPESRAAWRSRVRSEPDIPARLVAALTGKPIPVTGYALPHEAAEQAGAAKPTHLAVPAGSVYYFQADSKEAAEKLAAALNWHGADDFTTLRNRRSTLFGEKGFGLGVCGTWNFHSGKLPTA